MNLARFACSKRMRRFIPQLAWTGVSIAFYSGSLTPMLTDTIKTVSEDDTDLKL
jgi:hypothetical protein